MKNTRQNYKEKTRRVLEKNNCKNLGFTSLPDNKCVELKDIILPRFISGRTWKEVYFKLLEYLQGEG